MPHCLVTGATGYVGAALIPRLLEEGHDVRAYARRPEAVEADVPVVEGDAIVGSGLDEALEGIDVAYYLLHSMAGTSADGFDELEARAARHFADAAERQGVRRVVFLGGLLPPEGTRISRHMASRLNVERILLAAVPEGVAFRASIVVGAGSSSFRFLVHLVERSPLLPLPRWRRGSTQPIDERDVLAFLTAAATIEGLGSESVDIAGPDVVTYAELVGRITDALLVSRVSLKLPFNLTPIAAPVAAAIASSEVGLIQPLMESLEEDLLPRDEPGQGVAAARRFGVRLHSYSAAIERALRDMEAVQELRAR